MATDFIDTAVNMINVALNCHDYMRAKDEIFKVEIAGFRDEAESLRRCAGSCLTPPRENGHKSKPARKVDRHVYEQKDMPYHSGFGTRIATISKGGNVRITQSVRVNNDIENVVVDAQKYLNIMQLIPHPKGFPARSRERLPSITMLWSRHKERFQLVPHPVITTTRMQEKLPCKEMLIYRNKRKYQIIVHPDGGSPRTWEKLPNIDMIRYHHKEKYQIIVHPNGGNPRMRERLPSVDMLRRRSPVEEPVILEPVTGEYIDSEELKETEKQSIASTCTVLIVHPNGGNPRTLEALPSPEMLIRRRIRLERLASAA